MSAKVKKPFYKKWWVWLIAVILIIGIFGGGDEEPSETESAAALDREEAGEENEDKETSASETEVTEEETDQEEEEPEEEQEDKSAEISAGTYKVGEDISSGEYLVFSDGMGYIEAAKDSTGELDSIIFNDNLLDGAHAYVTLEDGQYFKLQGAAMYPVEAAPSVEPEDGTYTDGMYKVGQDIPAGEYKVNLNDSSAIGMGYLEVSSDSSHQLDSIITNDNVEADTYITIEDGQYLKLQDLTIAVE